MKITRIVIDRPVTTSLFFVAVILLGIVSLRQLSVSLLPEINTPRLSVVTSYPGVAPEEIETLVTAPLEASVARIPGLIRIESVSREGVSTMTLEFKWGTDMDFALLHTRERLDAARDLLPEDAEKPTIIPHDPQSRPIMTLALTGDRSLLELKEFAEELVKPRLEQVEGIASAEITGGVEREIQIELDPSRLALYGLNLDTVARRIDAFNRNLQGGTIRKGRFKYAFRIVGEYETPAEIGEIGLTTGREQALVRLKDVALIHDAIKEREGLTRLDGKESIGILVRKESGANTVKATRRAKEAIEQIRKENPGVGLHVISEQSKYIEQAVGTAKDEVLWGAVLAFLVLIIFLREWKTPLIIGTVIPISVVGTFNLLFFNDLTLNIMSLGGLALGVGMLDDCAVVVSESIFRHRSLGKKLKDAAFDGTKEVGMAVTATALTTIVVFLPVVYVRGIAGQLFKDVALTVTFALLSSLLVSLTLLPMLSSREFKRANLSAGSRRRPQKIAAWPSGPKTLRQVLLYPLRLGRGLLYLLWEWIAAALRFVLRAVVRASALVLRLIRLALQPALDFVSGGFHSLYDKFAAAYERFLDWSLDNKRKVMAASLFLLAATLGLGALLRRELMPPMKTASFELDLKAPVEYSLDQTSELVLSLESHLKEHAPLRRMLSQVGIVSGTESLNPDVSLNTAKVYVELEKPSQVEPVLASLRRKLAAQSGLEYSFHKEQAALGGLLGLAPSEVDLKVQGENLEKLAEIADELARALARIDGLADVKAGTGGGKPEFLVGLRKDALDKYGGLSPSEVGQFLVNAVRGRVATQFKSMDKKYDVRLRLEARAREHIDSLLNASFPHGGSLIPLRELVSYFIVEGPTAIRRENQRREVLVTAGLRGAKISQVIPAVRNAAARISLPEGYRIVFGGEREEMEKSFRSLLLAFVLAVVLIYMIMAAQFESFLHPFLILFTLPMGLAGSVIALFLTGLTINVISVIGAVVMVGIVVDNAIVKIDYTNQLRTQGRSLREAVVEGSRVRLRPIMMSTMSTIFGLIPMAVGLGKGAELLQPLAVTVIGGLVLSTFLTLVLIPVAYEGIERGRAA